MFDSCLYAMQTDTKHLSMVCLFFQFNANLGKPLLFKVTTKCEGYKQYDYYYTKYIQVGMICKD